MRTGCGRRAAATSVRAPDENVTGGGWHDSLASESPASPTDSAHATSPPPPRARSAAPSRVLASEACCSQRGNTRLKVLPAPVSPTVVAAACRVPVGSAAAAAIGKPDGGGDRAGGLPTSPSGVGASSLAAAPSRASPLSAAVADALASGGGGWRSEVWRACGGVGAHGSVQGAGSCVLVRRGAASGRAPSCIWICTSAQMRFATCARATGSALQWRRGQQPPDFRIATCVRSVREREGGGGAPDGAGCRRGTEDQGGTWRAALATSPRSRRARATPSS